MNDQQRTEAWHIARQGKITASECYVLLKNHKEDMTAEELAAYKEQNPKSRAKTKEVPFSDATFTYLDKKIAEYYMTKDAYLEYVEINEPHSKALDWGVTFEDKARKRYCQEMNVEVEDAPFIPLKGGFEKFAGGSPDGLLIDDNAIIEIKCPFNPSVHLKNFLMQKPQDLLEENEQYYMQCQYNMLVRETETNKLCPYADFISYDPRISIDKQLKVLRIPKDEETQMRLLERTEIAVEYYRQRMADMSSVSSIIK